MQAARRREIDLIVVWKLDRWGRAACRFDYDAKRVAGFGCWVCFSDRGFGFTH